MKQIDFGKYVKKFENVYLSYNIMLFCIWATCSIYIASLANQLQFCRDKEIEQRMEYIQYLENWSAKCYRLGASGEQGCYDCTGMIFRHFSDKKRTYKDNTKYYNIDWVTTTIDKAKTGDLVLFLERHEWQGTHTATFIRKTWVNTILILDAFEEWTKNTYREIPIQWNFHKIKIIENPYLES